MAKTQTNEKPSRVTFFTRKYKSLRVVLDPVRRKDVAGTVVTEGLFKTFKDGLPFTVEFQNGQYETDRSEVINALKSHPSYGMAFFAGDEDKVEPTVEAVARENERRSLVEELQSQCPECGKKFKDQQSLNGHMRVHKDETSS